MEGIKMLRRINSIGLEYHLYPVGQDKTEIRRGEKGIKVNHNIEKLNQAWFEWTQKGKFLQHAFWFLNQDEREFLLSGITPEEWNKIFGGEDEED